MNTTAFIIFGIVLVTLLIVMRTLTAYHLADPKLSAWKRFMLVFKDSETILWARIQMLGGALLGLGAWASTFFSDPAVSTAVNGILDPKYVPIYIIALAAITDWVRRHRTTTDSSGALVDAQPPAVKS